MCLGRTATVEVFFDLMIAREPDSSSGFVVALKNRFED
jgi:hypothetical protein